MRSAPDQPKRQEGVDDITQRKTYAGLVYIPESVNAVDNNFLLEDEKWDNDKNKKKWEQRLNGAAVALLANAAINNAREADLALDVKERQERKSGVAGYLEVTTSLYKARERLYHRSDPRLRPLLWIFDYFGIHLS